MRASTSSALAVSLSTATLVAATALPAAAHPEVPLPPAPLDAGFTATDNVEHVARFPQHVGTAGARLVDDRLYLTDPRGVYVYDVSDPLAPTELGRLALPQSGVFAALAQEEPDTDGHILLVDAVDPGDPAAGDGLKVVDVSDPTDMQVIGSAPVGDHTWTCVSTHDNGCAYAYGRTGHIVDLTDPTAPRRLDVSWREHVGLSEGFGNSPYVHDLTEVRTGRVMSAGAHSTLMDTTDPAAPRPVHDHVVDYHQFGYHGVDWAHEGSDRFLIAGTEIAPAGPLNLGGSDCQGEGSWISVYDTTSVQRAERPRGRAAGLQRGAQLELVDTFHVEDRGLFLDGNAPGHILYCAHWVDLAPDWRDGGRFAAAYYDWGTRFVEVDDDGHAQEIGWFVPVDGYTGSPRWVSDDVVYVMDYRRGLDILRLTGEDATGTVIGGVEVSAGRTLGDLDAFAATGGQSGGGGPVHLPALLLGAGLLGIGAARRARVAQLAPEPA